jgi:hypothetical protein
VQRTRRWSLAGGALGAGLGLLVGGGLLTAVSVASVARPRSASARLAATHLPPLLTAGEPVVLRYDVYCVGADDPSAACDAGGTVYARSRDSEPFQAVPLRLDPGALEGRYAVRVPQALARSGFSYYAVLRDARTGASTELPVGAPNALERSAPLGGSAVVVPLGAHVFGSARPADARVVSAQWGGGSGEVGLEERGPDATPIGASSFDVDSAARATVLDEAHRRLLRWSPGTSGPDAVSVAVSGTIADVASGPDGATYVLEAGEHGSNSVLRGFDARGFRRSATDVGAQAEAVRTGPDGPVVLEPQSGRWSSSGRPEAVGVGRPVEGGLRLVVYRPDTGEVRVAEVTATGTVVHAWRIESSTPIGEVQLAEPLGGRLVLVLRVYDDTQAEFVALVLGGAGVEQQFSLDASDWAETAPLGRFRLARGSLYRLGSTPSGMFVDRYDLGVS